MKGPTFKICTKTTTNDWADRQHAVSLKVSTHKALPQASGDDDERVPMEVDNQQTLLAEKFSNLIDAMMKREMFELQKKKKAEAAIPGSKKFEKLSPIIRNILLIFTAVPGMTQDEFDELAPTDNALSLLEISSGLVVRQILHNHMRRKGCMVYLQLSMCYSLKQLIIASFTDIFTCSNLCVFHCGPEKVGEDINETESVILAEKAALGELKKDDITVLTKNEKYLPFDFWGFEHMIKNFYTLASYLGGEHCLTARAWKNVLAHAQEYQALYRKLERDNQYFYISVCDDLNRRTQTFIHSGAGGNLDEAKKGHLEFSSILDDIESNKYHIRKPSWLPKKRKDNERLNNQNGGGHREGHGNQNQGNQQRPNQRRRFIHNRGELV